MEVGIGHHGEPGIEVAELETATQMAKRMVDVVCPDYPFESGDEVVVLVSGLGATPVMELYVLYDEIDKLLTEKGIKTHKAYVGNYFTSLDIKDYLGEVDGLIGDGDHGMNMNKGFTLFGERFGDKEFSFTEGLDELGMILFNEIGGSMGPIYGSILSGMVEAGEDLEEITLENLGAMLAAGLSELQDIVEARVGDKTLVDTLSPAADSIKKSAADGDDYKEALNKMKAAAEAGRDSTKDMVAKFGRSSRLGERSRGVLDAGATSCCIILCAMADGIAECLE